MRIFEDTPPPSPEERQRQPCIREKAACELAHGARSQPERVCALAAPTLPSALLQPQPTRLRGERSLEQAHLRTPAGTQGKGSLEGGATCLRTGSGEGSADSGGAALRLRRLGVRGDILPRQWPTGAFPRLLPLRFYTNLEARFKLTISSGRVFMITQ